MPEISRERVFEESLGKGIRYPDIFSSMKGSTRIVEGRKKVEQSIRDIILTRKGERVMEPEYGSDVREAVFEPNDKITQDLVVYYVKDALRRWEDRIKVEEVVAEVSEDEMDKEEEHHIRIVVYYRINRTNIRDNTEVVLEREV